MLGLWVSKISRVTSFSWLAWTAPPFPADRGGRGLLESVEMPPPCLRPTKGRGPVRAVSLLSGELHAAAADTANAFGGRVKSARHRGRPPRSWDGRPGPGQVRGESTMQVSLG